MFDPSIIFQRTHSGRAEIHEKNQGLTQSERLVLIMIDGVATYKQVRARLPVLTDARFDRAVQTLLDKGLISEVFLPVAGVQPEAVDRSVVDRFLQQDPLDPVTIMLQVEDERFDPAPGGMSARQPVAQVLAAPVATAATHLRRDPVPLAGECRNGMTAPVLLEKRTVQVAPECPGEVDLPRYQPEPWSPSLLEAEIDRINRLPPRSVPHGFLVDGAQWGYWAASVGGAFMLGFAMARITG